MRFPAPDNWPSRYPTLKEAVADNVGCLCWIEEDQLWAIKLPNRGTYVIPPDVSDYFEFGTDKPHKYRDIIKVLRDMNCRVTANLLEDGYRDYTSNALPAHWIDIWKES